MRKSFSNAPTIPKSVCQKACDLSIYAKYSWNITYNINLNISNERIFLKGFNGVIYLTVACLTAEKHHLQVKLLRRNLLVRNIRLEHWSWFAV